ncbi:MAG: prepilin-type N-terminal cleavage/methylation domain-containing protein [Gammaproteobacteria bacterium]|nr:GspH/FimT family pseudopilin [Gammaproteobacteria bacterium]NNL07428.1 prepilin-type N-terminal cleavage/methylation domain-containing protein [Gammaproteobacteria bacterium]
MKKSFGYTLIELMTVLAVVSVVVTVGLPLMNVFFDSNRMITNTNDLVAGLNIARSEAIKQQIRVTLCQSADTASCTGAGQWEDGWIVFQDPNGNATVDGGERILRLSEGAEGDQVTIRSNDVTSLINTSVTFTSRGLPKALNGASQSGTFRICDKRGLKTNADGTSTVARGVNLSPSGKVRSTNQLADIVSCP